MRAAPVHPLPTPPGPRSSPAARRRVLVGSLVVGPPTVVLGAVLTASALDVSAPASTLLAGTTTGPAPLVLRAVALVLLAAAALGVHEALLRRGLRASAAGAVVLGAAPLGGLALVEPGPVVVGALVVAVVAVAPAARRRHGWPGLVAPAALAVLLAGPVLWLGAGDHATPSAAALGALLTEVPRTAGRVGGAGTALPLLLLAAVLTRGRARVALSLLAGGAGLLTSLAGG